jgi:peptide chain release factor 1
VVVARQDQRSQHQNKEKAMESLESKIMESSRRKFEESVSDERRSQIGTADRSEKIRTYNFPQNRLTDHRIGKSWQNLDRIMEGDLKKIIGSLMKREGVRKK